MKNYLNFIFFFFTFSLLKANDPASIIKRAEQLSLKYKNDAALGLIDSAINAYTTSATVIPTSQLSQLYYFKGIYELKVDKPDASLKSFKKSAQLDPGNCLTFYKAGQVFALTDQIDSAIVYFSKSVLKDSNFAPAYFNRGYWQNVKGKKDEAFKDFEKAHLLDMADSEYLLALAELLIIQGKKADACNYITSASNQGYAFANELRMAFCEN